MYRADVENKVQSDPGNDMLLNGRPNYFSNTQRKHRQNHLGVYYRDDDWAVRHGYFSFSLVLPPAV